jgi:exopolyphosphatase/guanosine-5'-triphosphate,3'-diphosphate pyrophosphatase
MRSAIIDLGTNTFNLLVYEPDQHGRLRIVHAMEKAVFLGRGGIEQGIIASDAFERGIEALKDHRATALAHGAATITGFGTSALRNARNADAFVQQAAELGIAITIVPGEEEAGLILDGVRQAVSLGNKPTLIMDIGGGSTEFILATGAALMWKQSFELGVTRLRERIPIRDPITVEEEARIAKHLDSRLEPLWAIIDRHEPHLLVGSAGSFDTLAAIVAAEQGSTLAPDSRTLAFDAHTFDALKDRLLRMTRDERLQVPGLPEHRVDTLPYALVQIERVLTAGGIRDLAWSRFALKEGAAARQLQMV